MLNSLLVLCQQLSSDSSVSWQLTVVVLIALLSHFAILLLALFSDKVNARLVKIIQAKKSKAIRRK
jgi:hypothetical protein